MKPKVLFLCTGNACRSQMAEGWARHLFNGTVEAYSAGTRPHGLDSLAMRAMFEAGVDISSQRSKHVGELHNVLFDLAVTVCDRANEDCPVIPGGSLRLHAGFDDPPRLARDATSDEEAMNHYRRVRDEIRDFVKGIPAMLKRAANENPKDRRRVVLFLCIENSARSQMAEALLRHLAGDRFEVQSAGLKPSEVHPLTKAVLEEVGIDTKGLWAKGVDRYLGKQRVDHAIIVCAVEQKDCPRIYPFALEVLHWPFENPAAGQEVDGAQIEGFRRVRDEIRSRIELWLKERPRR